jgi:hypothetical protein
LVGETKNSRLFWVLYAVPQADYCACCAEGQFLLFCTGCFLVGVYQAFSQYYRLVAADPPRLK